MNALLWIVCFLILCGVVGLAYAFIFKKPYTTLSDVLLHSATGLSLIIIILFLLNTFWPLKEFLNPVFYTVLLLIGTIALIKKRPKIDAAGVVAIIFYFLFSIFVFQLEIQNNSIVSFGGNGDFFIHERLVRYLTQLPRKEVYDVNTVYYETAARISYGYQYPSGAHVLLAFFGEAIKPVVNTPVMATYHKLFMSYAFLMSVVILYRWKKNISLAAIISVFVFSFPIVHSIVGMDFIAQEAAVFLIVVLLSKFLRKDFSIETAFMLFALGITYYFSLVLFLPVFAVYVFHGMKKKKEIVLFCIFVFISLFLYFSPNLQAISEEITLGGLDDHFSLQELTNIQPILYNPAFNSTYLEARPSYHSLSLAHWIVIGILSLATALFTKIPILRSLRQFSLETAALVLTFIIPFFIYNFSPDKSYIHYKIFSYLIYFLPPILLFFFTSISIRTPPLISFVKKCIFITLASFITLNFLISVDYHNNWLRRGNAALFESENYQIAVENLSKGIVLLHRNVHFKSLVSLNTFPNQNFYSDGFYFDSRPQALKSEDTPSNYCDLNVFDPHLVSMVLIEKGYCRGKRMNPDYPFDNTYNETIVVHSLLSTQ